MESGGVFAFELASFNCVGRKRTNESEPLVCGYHVQMKLLPAVKKIAKKNVSGEIP